MTELVDVADLKSAASYTAYGFDSRPGHQNGVLYESADRFENPVGQGSAGFLAFWILFDFPFRVLSGCYLFFVINKDIPWRKSYICSITKNIPPHIRFTCSIRSKSLEALKNKAKERERIKFCYPLPPAPSAPFK